MPPLAPRRVAVFRALQLGDLLCAVPALRALRGAWPRAKTCLIGLPWAADFVRRMPYLDEFIAFPGFPGMPERAPDMEAWPAYVGEVRKRRFDLVIQMHGCGVLTNALTAVLHVPRSAGFFVPGQDGPQPDVAVPWPEDMPEVRRLLMLAESLGASARGEHLELPILPEEAAAWVQLRRDLMSAGADESHGYVCIHPGARLASRRWPPERFAAVADELAGAGYRIVLTGSAEEADVTARVAAHMAADAEDLAGRTELGTLAALVAQAELVICNDTGISHVAAATCTPSVVVCCGADAARWQPLDRRRHQVLWHPVGCRPCDHDRCPTNHECAQGVAVRAVVREAFSLLSVFGDATHAPA